MGKPGGAFRPSRVAPSALRHPTCASSQIRKTEKTQAARRCRCQAPASVPAWGALIRSATCLDLRAPISYRRRVLQGSSQAVGVRASCVAKGQGAHWPRPSPPPPAPRLRRVFRRNSTRAHLPHHGRGMHSGAPRLATRRRVADGVGPNRSPGPAHAARFDLDQNCGPCRANCGRRAGGRADAGGRAGGQAVWRTNGWRTAVRSWAGGRAADGGGRGGRAGGRAPGRNRLKLALCGR